MRTKHGLGLAPARPWLRAAWVAENKAGTVGGKCVAKRARHTGTVTAVNWASNWEDGEPAVRSDTKATAQQQGRQGMGCVAWGLWVQ